MKRRLSTDVTESGEETISAKMETSNKSLYTMESNIDSSMDINWTFSTTSLNKKELKEESLAKKSKFVLFNFL